MRNVGWLNPPLFLFVLSLGSGCTRSELCVGNVHTVTPDVLIRGAQPDAAGFVALHRAYGIRTVVNLNDRTAESEKQSVEQAGMNYIAIPCNAFHPEAEKFEHFLREVELPRNRPVYVHCHDGMDRTGMAVAVFRIVIQGWTADRALAELRSYQTLPHILLFQDVPVFVEQVAAHRDAWSKALLTSVGPKTVTR